MNGLMRGREALSYEKGRQAALVLAAALEVSSLSARCLLSRIAVSPRQDLCAPAFCSYG